MNEIETKTAHLSLLDGNIVSIRYKTGAVLTLENSKKLFDAILQLNPNVCPVLVFYNNSMSFDFESIRFLAKSKNANAIAIVHKEIESTVILNSIFNLFTVMKAEYKMKFFSNENDAIKWLAEYIQ